MKNIRVTPLIIWIMAFFASPLWAQNANPVSLKVLQGWQNHNQTRIAALHLSLQDGWKTYWRVPGDSGIPPVFDWRRSKNLRAISVIWPQPEIFREGETRTIGYAGELVVPLHIKAKDASRPIRLRGQMDIGICSDVCVPIVLKFDAQLNAVGHAPTSHIAASMASAPFSARQAGVKRAACKISPAADGMRIETEIAMPPAGHMEEVVIEAGDENIWVSQPKARRQSGVLVAQAHMYHQTQKTFLIERSKMRITVIGSDYSVEINGCKAR